MHEARRLDETLSLVAEDCGGMPALALRKYTDEQSIEAIEQLAKQAAVFDTRSKYELTMYSAL
jgi:hypothetical protein